MSDVEILPEVIDQARRLGMYGNVSTRLCKMVKQAAPFTHPDGNMRFESFVFRVEESCLVAVTKHDPHLSGSEIEVVSQGDEIDFNLTMITIVCPDCEDDGEYCGTCNTTGKLHCTVSRAQALEASPEAIQEALDNL